MMRPRLLLAEDARDVAKVVSLAVRLQWPEAEVAVAESGGDALRLFEEMRPDLVILDVAMPPPDGFEVCRLIRAQSQVPILMLTVRDRTVDKVRGLDLGADDYLTKPFDHLELLARIRALLRRPTMAAAPLSQTVVVGELRIDAERREVWRGPEKVHLTVTEYRLLEELVRHAGIVLTHDMLLERVWGPEYVGESHYLAVYIGRLRQKLGADSATSRYIETEWGIGYRFAAPIEE